ncbi:MAG TPA: nuclease, partial [Planctomycetota bacterium]|nr:nuclease [Planctomycetota bacterium]
MARAPLLLAFLAAACATRTPDLPARLAPPPAAAAPADEMATEPVAPTAAATRIRDIQGAAQRSPLDGQAVVDVPGIVTAVVKRGFWLQDPAPDEDPATSEALFVHLDPPQLDGAPLRPGDELLVSGTVGEYVPASRKGQLPVTQIDTPTLRRVARDRPCPALVRVGRGGRRPPTDIVCDDARDGDACAGPFDPAHDGLDFWESLEGMLVELDEPVACSPTSSLGELWVLADGGADVTGRNARGGVTLRAGDVNPERIQLASLLAPVARVDVGTRLAQDGQPRVRGVLDYAFANWRLDVLAPVTAAGGGVAPESVPAAAAPDRELLVACLNLENLSPASDAAKLAGLARLIGDSLAAPDILAVEEVQDDSGPVKDGTVSAAGTLRALTDAIVAAGGPRYRSADIAPADGADGGQPGANIRCALLWREDRGVRLVERPGAAAAHVVREGDAPALRPSPALVAPQEPCWKDSRKPLAAEFRWGGGAALFVIANHW